MLMGQTIQLEHLNFKDKGKKSPIVPTLHYKDFPTY